MHGWFMSMYDKNHYNTVISLQLKKKKKAVDGTAFFWQWREDPKDAVCIL